MSNGAGTFGAAGEASAHEHYHERLRRLADPVALMDVLEAQERGPSAGAATGIQPGPRDRWTRVYGRFLPFRAPYAVLVFERRDVPQSIVTVELFDAAPMESERQPATTLRRSDDYGWLRTTMFPHDRQLPTLGEALTVDGDLTVVRYRPGRRCTFRVTDRRGTRFGKVFRDESGLGIHDAGTALDRACRRGVLGFAVAPPMAWDAARRVLWQGVVPGAPLLDRLSTDGAERLACQMGAALGTLAVSTIQPTVRFDAAVQCARTHAYARELGTRVPALATEATSLGEGLSAIHRRRAGRVCPIHGAPHVNQWLADGDRLALVDFDRFSAGNPELDVATFLGELDFEEDLATPVPVIARAFVDGYQQTAGPLDTVLLAAYRAHKRLAKALRSARALRPDGGERARRHLALAQAALAEAEAA